MKHNKKNKDDKRETSAALATPIIKYAIPINNMGLTYALAECCDYTQLTPDIEQLTTGWYLLGSINKSKVVFVNHQITIKGNVKFILGAGVTWRFLKGIKLSGADNKLTIYGQSGESGMLIANSYLLPAASDDTESSVNTAAQSSADDPTVACVFENELAELDAEEVLGVGIGGYRDVYFEINSGTVRADRIGTVYHALGNVDVVMNGGHLQCQNDSHDWTFDAVIGSGSASIGDVCVTVNNGFICSNGGGFAEAIGQGAPSQGEVFLNINGGVVSASSYPMKYTQIRNTKYADVYADTNSRGLVYIDDHTWYLFGNLVFNEQMPHKALLLREKDSLYIPRGVTLELAEGSRIVNDGLIYCEGEITGKGRLEGKGEFVTSRYDLAEASVPPIHSLDFANVYQYLLNSVKLNCKMCGVKFTVDTVNCKVAILYKGKRIRKLRGEGKYSVLYTDTSNTDNQLEIPFEIQEDKDAPLTDIEYCRTVAENTKADTVMLKEMTSVLPVTSDTLELADRESSNGWYAVSGTVVLHKRLKITGTIKLILTDDCILQATKGIELNSDNDKLIIYGQSKQTGKLIAYSDKYDANIGNSGKHDSESLSDFIHKDKYSKVSVLVDGGDIELSPTWGAGIGTGFKSGGSVDITILSGKIHNKSTENSIGAVLGCGYIAGKPEMLCTRKKSDKDLRMLNLISISGGNLQLEGRKGACLGTGMLSLSNTLINIFGGSLHVSSVSGAGIGFGTASAGKLIINITGGDIFSNSDKATAIGAGDICEIEGSIEISGGTVNAFSRNNYSIGKALNSSGGLKFNTGIDGKAEIHTTRIENRFCSDKWSGLIVEDLESL